ncbi:MAG TPA: PQQ-binding-like beta-propeller repeat protein [Verrucomicrobiae bacterium]|nr:PQQ-binding-like beta-propeller repeat protein [Verrucomicrobiae bacterium]
MNLKWPKEGPTVLWQMKVGEGFSGPVIAEGRLILFHRIDDTERLDCVEARTGKAVWHYEYSTAYQDDFSRGNGPRATPAIAEGRVFAFGPAGILTCLNFTNGSKLWSLDTQKEFRTDKGFFGMACSPLVEGRVLLMNIGGKGADIVAFDVASGKVLWKAGDDEASYSSPVAVTINGKRYVLFLTRKFLTALDPSTGKTYFNFPWQPAIHASVSAATPLVVGDLVFISASYGAGAAVLKFKESGPEKLWSGDDILSNHYATSVHHDGFLYGFDGRQEQGCNLRCAELKTGKVRWSLDRFGAGTVTLAANELLVLTEKGELIAAPANPAEFKPVVRAQILPYGVRAYPAIADGLFYARSNEKLVCLDLRKSN